MPGCKHIINGFLLILVSTLPVYAQQSDEILNEIRIFDKFGIISPEDREIENGSEYPFEYLLKESSIRFDQRDTGIVALIDYLVRIKVYSDDPVDITEAALVGIPFYFSENMERITNLEGRTHQPDGTFTLFQAGRARTVDLNSRYKILEFEMPDVRQGSIIEYKYTLERRYIEELPDFYFSHRVPVREVNLYLKNENFMRFDAINQNIDFELNYSESRVDTSSIPFVFTYERPEPVFIQQWSADEIPAIDVSAFVSSLNDIRGQLKFQISEFGNPRQPLENSWEFVAAQMQRSANPFRTIEDNKDLLEMGKSMFEHISDLSVRQDSIFEFVNSTVQYNGEGTVFADSGLDHVLEGESANQAEINTVLLALLRGAGIAAKPLYISGREFGRINEAFPSLYQFNRMLVVSEINGINHFMDASYSHSLPDLIPVESYNEQGMTLEGREYEWITIAPERSLFFLDLEMDAALDANGGLKGKLKATTRGYPAREIRRDLNIGVPADEISANTFFEVYSDAVIINSIIEISESDPDRVDVEFDFEIPDYSVTFTDGIEFRPMVVGYLFDNPFESTERRAPITLDAPENLSIKYTIELPEGFESDVAGETRSTSLRGAELFEEYLADGGLIEYSFDITISRKEFPADQYSQLRQLYQRWVELSNDIWFIEKN